MAERNDGRLEKLRKKMDLLDYGQIAVGFIFGMPLLVASGAFGVATSQTVGKEFTKKMGKLFKRKKK